MTLEEAPVGLELVIDQIAAGEGATRRLLDLGVYPGVRVSVIASHPWRGPVVVRVGGTRVALGRGLARKILVRQIDNVS
ncbi:MAG: ferrous iron transport protein A [Candidatus Fermentithermobacillus carboniphilus]|uniref:Ferrous iron transport protein A n=1 Tax=Candidatus Fermentithermobacillus carboniphilus TaxID=3085328 RepID=A0AAT9LFA3_9FIRM|nr:MAG: ferrous iron transport protein A [Candidatus Fermentithermobacillus carboniphilus]